MKALENYRECLGALESERSAWKHLSKRDRREVERERERERERSQGETCA